METPKPRLVTVDDRRRISIGWTKMVSKHYRVTVERDGTIILTPVWLTTDPGTNDEQED